MAEKSKREAPVVKELTVEELLATHELYDAFKDEWDFLYAAYEGTRELVNLGYLVKHERETSENYENRKKQAYGFGYSQSVVDTFNFYLFKKSAKRNVPEPVENDKLYKMFQEDCNLEGEGLDEFLTDQSRLASILGFMGILVDKSDVEPETRQQQIDDKVYPYLAPYYPQAILDWDIARNEYGRPTLKMIKLVQDDASIVIWYEDHFEIWEEPVDPDGNQLTHGAKATLRTSVFHDLEEIPFIWHVNKKWRKRPIGKSDIPDIARIDVSIIRNLSQGEEIIDYSAFPMMRKPYEEGRPDQVVDKADDVGPTAILGFDPDNPDAKPDWLKAEAEGPLNAIKDWIASKVAEIYRSSNIGGMAATEVQTQAKSGTALQAEFQLLNSSLVRKAISLEKSEKLIHWFFYKWEFTEKAQQYIEETTIERERTYDVENLAQDLDNVLTAKTIVLSNKFNEMLQKKTVRQMFPSYNDSQLSEVDEEIEAGIEEKEQRQEEMKNYDPFAENNQKGGQPNPFQPQPANSFPPQNAEEK